VSARPLRIGTRASALALWQAHHVEGLLNAQRAGAPVELVHISTAGDLQGEVPLWQAEGRAFFTKEIDRALLEGTVRICRPNWRPGSRSPRRSRARTRAMPS
jgi:hydroxymethylbilane synthase